MLARTYRLRKNSDFQRLYKSAKRFASANLILYYAPSTMEYSQIGFVVSKKVAKSAVIRNTLRRRVSAIVEQNFVNIKSPVKAIILIRKDFSASKPAQLQQEVEGLIKGILK